MNETLGITVHLPVGFGEASARTREALKAEGFGVLTEIDLQAAFRDKLGRDFRRYVILGACNPPLAWRAVHADPTVGLLLPCNVTLEEDSPTETTVRLVDPMSLLGSAGPAGSGELAGVAVEARARLERVAGVLRAPRSPEQSPSGG
jgi:uncharacterized protein (DUF302 family)